MGYIYTYSQDKYKLPRVRVKGQNVVTKFINDSFFILVPMPCVIDIITRNKYGEEVVKNIMKLINSNDSENNILGWELLDPGNQLDEMSWWV